MYTFFFPKKKNYVLYFHLIIALLLLMAFSSAGRQDHVIKGQITDDAGAAIPFAVVQVKTTSIGVQADINGYFSLVVKTIPVTILIQSVGYESLEMVITEKNIKKFSIPVKMVLTLKESTLSEVVVTSAIPQKRHKMSLSVSTSVASAPAVSVRGVASMGALEGKVAGLSVKNSSDKAFKPDRGHRRKEMTGTVMSKNPVEKTNKTSLLTAGEVNDFKKWKMWEDYTEHDFEEHARRWQLFVRERFSVQVVNRNDIALAGKKLYLLNKSNADTLWQGVSDNTGKAELWNGINNKIKNTNICIKIEKDNTEYPAIPFSQGINRIVSNDVCSQSDIAQIAFVVDATGSMQDEIDYLKEELGDILTKISAKDSALQIHSGAVFYRDKGDAYLTAEQPLSKGIDQTIAFIKKQAAGGGGDYPEAVNDGLRVALNKMGWSSNARTRIIFLLMDAPPHDEDRTEMSLLIYQAAAMGIRVVPLACSGTDKATEFIMRSIALATNGTYLFLTDDSGIGNAHIKPTTDEFKVELLNNLMQRTIEQMCFVNNCTEQNRGQEPLSPIVNNEKIVLYPNPTRGIVTLQTGRQLKEIFVTDFTGKILFRKEGKATGKLYSVDLSGLPSATYFVKYITADNKQGAEKVILIK